MTEKKGKSLLDVGHAQTRQAARLFSSQERSISALRQALEWENISDEDEARINERLRASTKKHFLGLKIFST